VTSSLAVFKAEIG